MNVLKFDAASKLFVLWPEFSNHVVTFAQLLAEINPDDLGKYVVTERRNRQRELTKAKLSDAGSRFVIENGNLSHYG